MTNALGSTPGPSARCARSHHSHRADGWAHFSKPRDAAVFEDALAGVQAGREGGFGYVVGVDRVDDGSHVAALREAGADVVVTDLAELLPA